MGGVGGGGGGGGGCCTRVRKTSDPVLNLTCVFSY